MAATIFRAASASNLEFGVTDETSIIVTNYSRNVTSKKTEAMNGDGDVVGVAYTGIQADIKIDGYINGTVSMEIASVLTLSNDTTRYGLTGGTVLLDSISESTGSGEFTKISVSATQYSETLS